MGDKQQFVGTAKCVIQNNLHYIEPINMSGLLPSYGWYLNYFLTKHLQNGTLVY